MKTNRKYIPSVLSKSDKEKQTRSIIRKGKGAYYSSGSRPNQTPSSWGVARLASALTSGKSALVDSHLLLKGCKKGSKGYMSVQTAKRRYK